MPEVSVIIGTYNAEKYIKETILSVFNQTFKDFELIVVDDGSTDNTVRIIEDMIKPPHKLVIQKNQGEAGSRNTGLKIASGRYISFLDHDDLYSPVKLEKLKKFLDENKEFAMVYANQDYIITYGSGNNWINWSFAAENNGSGDIFIKQFIENKIHIITTMIKRECFEKTGEFDRTMNYASDSDMWIRVSANYRIGYLNESLAYYRLHSTNESLDRETCLIHRIASMNKNYRLFNDRVKGNKEILKAIRGLYYRLIKLYIKRGEYKTAWKYFKEFQSAR